MSIRNDLRGTRHDRIAVKTFYIPIGAGGTYKPGYYGQITQRGFLGSLIRRHLAGPTETRAAARVEAMRTWGADA